MGGGSIQMVARRTESRRFFHFGRNKRARAYSMHHDMRNLRNTVLSIGTLALLLPPPPRGRAAPPPPPPRAPGGPRQGAPAGPPRGHAIASAADADEPPPRPVDVDPRQEIAGTPLKGRPEQVLVLADGRVAVTLRSSNAVEVLEPAARETDPLAERCVIDTRAEPIALAATPDDATVLVTSGWAHAMGAFDAKTFAPKFEVNLPRDPRSIVVSDDGTRAFVAHVVEARMSVVDLATKEHVVRPVDLRARSAAGDESVDSTRKGCQGFALTKVEDQAGAKSSGMIDRIFAPMVSVNPGDGASESEGYGSESPPEIGEVAGVDASAERALRRLVRLPASGKAERECLLPRAAAYDDGALFVTCLGIDALVKLDARSLDPSRAELRRWSLAAGPVGVAVDHDGKRAVVWSQFDRELAFVGFDDDAPSRLALSRGSAGVTANIALGRRIFHQMGDARISADGRACASCHPDGREDALTWSTPDGPRQTIMLAGRLASTAPYGWMGAHANLNVHLTTTFQRLGGTGLAGMPGRFSEIEALAAYLN